MIKNDKKRPEKYACFVLKVRVVPFLLYFLRAQHAYFYLSFLSFLPFFYHFLSFFFHVKII